MGHDGPCDGQLIHLSEYRQEPPFAPGPCAQHQRIPRDTTMGQAPNGSAPCFREGPSRREYHKVICSLLDCYWKNGLARFKSRGFHCWHDALFFLPLFFPFFFCPMTMFAAFTQPGHYEIPVEKTALYSRGKKNKTKGSTECLHTSTTVEALSARASPNWPCQG